MSFIHFTLVGHFDPGSGFRNPTRPLDQARAKRLLAECSPEVARYVTFQNGYARCSWVPGGQQVYDFAYRLARVEGCLAVENGREVTYPPAAVMAQQEGWDEWHARTLTEQQWAAGSDPGVMILFLRGRASRRKLALFACACCRRVWKLLLDWSRHAVQVAERVADGDATDPECDRVEEVARAWETESEAGAGPASWYAGVAAVWAFRSAGDEAQPGPFAPRQAAVGAAAACGDARDREKEAQRVLLRDIFGNPFHPIDFSPAWRTSTVVALARGIYAERAFDRMPILADALMDAGCENEEILDHCRGPNEHVRGCWLVDEILGRA